MSLPKIVAPATGSRPDCDFLGLRHDPQTRLGFASNWNYCHRALPPASVGLEHQRQYCQTAEHVACPAFTMQKPGPLPADIRGKHAPKEPPRPQRSFVPGILVSLLVILAGGLIWMIGRGDLTQKPGPDQSLGLPTLAGGSGSGPLNPGASASPTSDLLVPLLFGTADISPTDASSLGTPTYFDPSPPTRTPVSTPPGVCGHQLDVPFGPGPKFIIHQAGGGDSLNGYELEYHTTLAAIEGLNDPFPIPLRKDSFVVIALDTKEVGDLPVFRPYLVSNRNTPIQTMAFKVSADLLAFEHYNEFDETCRDFIGWVLSPHERPAH